jgi:hypothetical protein
MSGALSGFRRRIGQETRFLGNAVRDPAILGRRARRVVSPRVAFLERSHDPGRSLLVVGSARSGSTWLAEVLVDALEARLVFEPLRVESVPLAAPVRFGRYVDPDDDPDPAIAYVLDQVLTGRIRDRWTDKFNTVRFPRCRVLKDVRATNLLPWIVRRYPTTPTVYLLRHPIPSAWSVAALGWPDKLEQFLGQEALMHGPMAPFRPLIDEAAASSDLFHRIVLRWCLENLVPIRVLDPERVHVAFYEDLVADPWRELKRLQVYLQGFDPGLWNLRAVSEDRLGRPSHTNYHDTDVSSGPSRLEDWVAQVPGPAVDRALALVGAFGLDRLYGRSTRPLIGPDQVLLGGAASGGDQAV